MTARDLSAASAFTNPDSSTPPAPSSQTASGGVCNASTGVWTMSALGLGSTETLSFSITYASGSVPTNTFSSAMQASATSDVADGSPG